MKLGWELFVAWRYLRWGHGTEHHPSRGLGTLAVGVALVGLGVYAQITVAALAPARHPGMLVPDLPLHLTILRYGSLVSAAVGVLTIIFAVLFRLQSIFTTISSFSVFLGTTALVIVLSVMNGFEVDLRKKILGSNSHLLVTKNEGSFVEWRDVQARLEDLCAREGVCVLASTPYLTSEVVIAASSNYSGVIIKGIDPASNARVTELEKNLAKGSSIDRLWPLLPDGGVAPYGVGPDAGPRPRDAGPPPDADGEPTSFDGEDEADAGATPAAPRDAGPRPLVLGRDAGPAAVGPATQPAPPRYVGDPRVRSLDGVLVGRELARNIHLFTGQEVQIVSPLGQDTPAGQIPRARSFRVAGTFFTGMYEYDTKFVYVTLPALQRFLSLGDEVTGIEIRSSDIDRTEALVRAVQVRLGPAYRVADWKELNRSLFSALKLEKVSMFVVLANIILVAALSIISNLIMVVVEKRGEIAILKSMGASDGGVLRVFVLEGLYIGALGTIFGLVVGISTCVALAKYGLPLNPDVYYIDRLPVAMDPWAILQVIVAGVAISVLATLYPSYIGARLRPVDGLRR